MKFQTYCITFSKKFESLSGTHTLQSVYLFYFNLIWPVKPKSCIGKNIKLILIDAILNLKLISSHQLHKINPTNYYHKELPLQIKK